MRILRFYLETQGCCSLSCPQPGQVSSVDTLYLHTYLNTPWSRPPASFSPFLIIPQLCSMIDNPGRRLICSFWFVLGSLSMATIASSFLTLASVTSPPTLTTTFSPSDFCTNDIHRVNDTQYEGFFFDHLGPLTSTSACFPSSWEPGTSVYFSPGLCPAGYETACSSLVSLGSVTETRATCCPQYVFF